MVELTRTALVVILALIGLAGLIPVLGVLTRERTLRSLEKIRERGEASGNNKIIDGH